MALNDVKEIQIPDNRYRQLEYIHFSGAEYINTNKTLTGPNTYKRATMKVSFQDVNRWSYCGYIGNNSNFVFGTRPTNLATFSLGAASYGTNAYALSTNTIYQYDLWVNDANNNNLTVSDESGTALWTSNALSTTWSANTGNLYIGACYDARSSGPSGYMIANIYSFIVRQPSYGVIVYNGIPCQRKSDGVCGMYDTISNTFNPMVGTEITDNAAGTTTAENMPIYVNKIESNNQIIWGSESAFPYRRLEYIHFNGNDYITTAFDPWNNFGYYLDIKWDSGQTGQFSGHGKVVSNNRAFIGTESGGKVMYGSGAVSNTVSNSNVYERHTYQVNTSSSSSGKFFIDGVQIGNNFASNFQETNRGKMYVGGVYRNTGDYSPVKANIYNVKFINNVSTSSTATWNWIPVQRKSDNAIGFLNLASNGNKIFVTSVNGLLEAGPVVDEYWDLTAPS